MPARKSNGKNKSSGKKRPARNVTPQPKTPAPSFGDRIKAVCKDISRTVSIIDMCRHAAASLYEREDPETMWEALTLAHDELRKSVGTLQTIAQDATKGGAR